MTNEGPNKKPDQAMKNLVIELARQGVSNVQIARDLNVHGQTVNGLVFNARKRGTLPPFPPKAGPVLQPAPAPPKAAPAPQPPPPAINIVRDDFVGGRPVLGGTGGFVAPSLQPKYLVERIIPPDGLLGSHIGSLTVDELGKEYGEGSYKIVRYEPGRAVPIEFMQKIASNYGRPRFPSQTAQKPSEAAAPTKMVKRSILNRLSECRKMLDSTTAKMRLNHCDVEALTMETDFLLYTMKDVRALIDRIPRNGNGHARKVRSRKARKG